MALLQSTKNRIARIAIFAAAGFFLFVASIYLAPPLHNRGDGARRTLALIEFLTQSVKQFAADTGRIPTQEEGLLVLMKRPIANAQGWHGPYFSSSTDAFRDAWGSPLIYKVAEVKPGEFVIYSGGMNRKDDHLGYDDISLDKKLEPCELFATCPPISEHVFRSLAVLALVTLLIAALDASAFVGLLLFRRIRRK